MSTIIERSKVVAVLRNVDNTLFDQSIATLVKHGITTLEITLDDPDAPSKIKKIVDTYGDQVTVGAGTVIETEQVQLARESGVAFIVSPHFDRDVVNAAKAHDLAVIPGVFTPTEIITALKAGVDAVKVFPATTLGERFFKDLAGPYKQLPIMATGGMTNKNAKAYLEAGVQSVGIGSWLVWQNTESLTDYDRRIGTFMKTLT
ncbi:4-hydroxy-2-oxoglutarate aldolase [Bacillus sp. JCM 19045]|nr:4-hydroxy-2-oxoglutarate aldolase [Bacillus sp. JCM 19045]